MEQKPATIKEIARRLNVSVSTVSRALHDHPSIGLRTKSQVKQLAKELNYEPNQSAIFFKQGKTFTIGVLLPNLREDFFSIAINAIEDVATKNNYTVLIGQSHDDLEKEKKIIDTMRRQRVDGVIVSLSKETMDYTHFEQLNNHNIPVVFFDRVPSSGDFFSVKCDLKKSSEQLVNWLVEKGHNKIGFINGPETMAPSTERLQGYLKGLKKNAIAANSNWLVSTDLSIEGTHKAMKRLLSFKTLPSAIIAFNDYVALDAIRYARNEGVKINEELCFVSFANLPITSYLDTPPLASVEQFPYEQAEKATEMLIHIINDKDAIKNLQRNVVLESKVMQIN